MNATLAEIFKGYVAPLAFTERLAGLARLITINEQTESGSIRKTFPVAFDVCETDCVAGKYKDLTPNSNKKSVLYFEEISAPQWVEQARSNFRFRSVIRLVGWLNLKKLGLTNNTWSADAIIQILAKIPQKPFNNGNLLKIKVTNISEAEKTAQNIFGKYTYDEAVNQYLLYPYDFFALNFTVDFEINPACYEAIEEQEPCECDNGGDIRSPIAFYTTAGKTDYTVDDIPVLRGMIDKTIITGSMDDTILLPGFRSWDNTTFSILNITVVGGEYITLFFKTL